MARKPSTVILYLLNCSQNQDFLLPPNGILTRPHPLTLCHEYIFLSIPTIWYLSNLNINMLLFCGGDPYSLLIPHEQIGGVIKYLYSPPYNNLTVCQCIETFANMSSVRIHEVLLGAKRVILFNLMNHV